MTARASRGKAKSTAGRPSREAGRAREGGGELAENVSTSRPNRAELRAPVDDDLPATFRFAAVSTTMTPADSTDQGHRRPLGPLLGMIAGSCLLVAGASGTIVTVWRIVAAFESVEGNAVAPENKAKVLAAGIESAMTATAVGIGLSVVGVVVTVAAGLAFFRARREAARPSAG